MKPKAHQLALLSFLYWGLREDVPAVVDFETALH